MRVWTIHSEAAWKALQTTGVLRYLESASHIAWDAEIFQEPYRWMSEMMTQKIGVPPQGVTYPVWFWAQWKSGRSKPDLRTVRSWYSPENWVRLQCNIPDNELLLSDHEAWHFVLNRWYLPASEVDYNLHNKPTQTDAIIRDSWTRIFDIDEPNDYLEYHSRLERQIQATAWEVRLSQVERADVFRGTRRD